MYTERDLKDAGIRGQARVRTRKVVQTGKQIQNGRQVIQTARDSGLKQAGNKLQITGFR